MKLIDLIFVDTSNEKYSVHVGYDLIKEVGLFRNLVSNRQVFILSHSEIAIHYLATLQKTCCQAGALQVNTFCIPSGEPNKTLTTAQRIWEEMLFSHHSRDTVVIGLGGGLIGDLAGFCAACYMRGVEVIQCPTSLLAQIDAVIGGKTAINFTKTKNVIGLFYPPRAVIIDLATLHTLSQREFVAGLGELIKYGLALDENLFNYIESKITEILERKLETLEQVITWSVRLKAQVVSEDERDNRGRRIILNFGHTIAHALESLLDYKQLLHGEAVAIGMVVATLLSIQKGNLSPIVLKRLVSLLNVTGLPVTLPDVSVGEVIARVKHDKKHLKQQLNWVLLERIGKARIDHEVTLEEITRALIDCAQSASL